MSQSIERDVRFLKRYAIVTTTMLAVLSVAAFTRASGGRAKFEEIDVERINIREPNGNYRMVLSNRPRSIGPIYKNKPFGYEGGNRPGIIFFNDEGTENGGLTFTGSTCVADKSVTTGRPCTKGTYNASTHMSFDQFNQDQVLNLDYGDNGTQRQVAISMLDRAQTDIHDFVMRRDSILKMTDTAARAVALRAMTAPRNGVPLSAQRVYLGRNTARAATLVLSDPSGRPRIRIAVDSSGVPSLEFLDERGAVTSRLPNR